MDLQKIEGLLGMAQRAGKIVSGEFAVQKAIASGKAAALIVAGALNGGLRDVLVKASHICTECSGLG